MSLLSGSHLCSAINASVYTIGPDVELDAWAEQLGAPSWSAASFKALFALPRHRGQKDDAPGPWHTSQPVEHLYPLTRHVLRALREAGVPNVDNPHAGERGPVGTGSFIVQQTHFPDGTKAHAGNAFLTDSVLARPNLAVRGGDGMCCPPC